MANNAKIKAAGIAPVIQTYQDSWTSQLFVLADFHNVSAAQPDLADEVHGQPGQVRHDAGRDAGLPTPAGHPRRGLPERGLRVVQVRAGPQGAGGRARARTTRCSPFAVGTMVVADPGQDQDIGFFALPGDDASQERPDRVGAGRGLHPEDHTGDKLDAAKKFLAFVASQDGCDVAGDRRSPRPVRTRSRAARCRPTCRSDQGHAAVLRQAGLRPAWRWSSSRRSRARRSSRSPSRWVRASARPKDGAALYDEDVKKQAQQLGLPGW